MKQISRSSQPDSFFSGEKKVEFYKNLYDEKNKIHDRWNYSTYQNDLQTTLLEMSQQECSFSGEKINAESMDIEHYLPKEKFPYLSYYFENYLASCKPCNQHKKRDFSPESLASIAKQLAEPSLIDEIAELEEYDRQQTLTNTTGTFL